MIRIVFFFIIFSIYGCNKPKSVLVCGDHVCINKAEAQQYFEDNLSLEVRIVDSKLKKPINLVELNLQSNSYGENTISISDKKADNNPLKELSNKEIKQKKAQLKIRKKVKLNKVKSKNNIKKKPNTNKFKVEKKSTNLINKKKAVNKPSNGMVDICNILDKCSIDEISKYLLKQGNKKNFPDITTRE